MNFYWFLFFNIFINWKRKTKSPFSWIIKKHSEHRVINNVVLSETLNGIRRYERRVNLKDIYEIITQVFDIDYLKKEDYSESVHIYHYYNGAINYSDCLILKNMQDRNINRILSYDDDFDKINGIPRIY